MSTEQRAWWLAGACDMADMGASLLVATPSGRRTIGALDTCAVEDGVLRCGEDGTELRISDLLVLAFRQDETAPWVALEAPNA